MGSEQPLKTLPAVRVGWGIVQKTALAPWPWGSLVGWMSGTRSAISPRHARRYRISHDH
ncbi:MAG: hypothetical protein QOH50_381 [Kribbellaceae bacterium]|jgi:hypothetical protein|nr:hypothetical protein [Kribbellaceae bacterium]